MNEKRKNYPTVMGLEFKSRYAMGDIVWFAPGTEGDAAIKYMAVVLGLTIKGPKVAYYLGLRSGAKVKTYGDRVFDLDEDVDLLDKDLKYFAKFTNGPGL